MARAKTVAPLFNLSLMQVCNLIIQTCEYMCKRHGPYSSSKLKKQLHFVQRYILSNIHPHFLDEMINSIDRLESFQWLTDDRLKSCIVAVCMHPRMKSFKPKFQLPVNDDLYTFNLKRMKHLTILNLSMVCTDEILEIVGRSCPLLESIDITSKVESASNSAIRFNALKLRFFVSDRGLEYLHKCKYLKRIVMNGIIRSNCGGRKISNMGIKNLLLNLTLLKYINYQDMGFVLEELSNAERSYGMLNLIHLQDNHVTLDHIDLFSALCPKLKSLSLCIPQTNSNQGLSESCLERLSTSNVTLSSIDLWFFTFNSSMLSYLILKGKYLNSLSLKDCNGIDTQSLIDVCTYCPNLKSLKINLLTNMDQDIHINKDVYFKYLEELVLAGRWDPQNIFNLCIFKSKNMKNLSLSNKGFERNLDREICSLMSRNSLTDLSELSLLEGCKVSFRLLKEFILYCKCLGRVTVIDDNSENLAEQLIQFISSNVFDISIDIEIKRSR